MGKGCKVKLMKQYSVLLLIALLFHSALTAENNPPKLLLRLDDNGMNHSVIMAIKQVAETGMPRCDTIGLDSVRHVTIFTCPDA